MAPCKEPAATQLPGHRARPRRRPSTTRTSATCFWSQRLAPPPPRANEPSPLPRAGPASHLRTPVHSTAGARARSGDPGTVQPVSLRGTFRGEGLGPLSFLCPPPNLHAAPRPPRAHGLASGSLFLRPLKVPQLTFPGGDPSSPSPPRKPEVAARGEPAVVPRCCQNKSPFPEEAPFALTGPCAPPATLPAQAPNLRCGVGSSAFGAEGVGNLILPPSPAA